MQERQIRGVSLSTLAALLNQGSTFAANLMLANLLGKKGFGEFALVLSTLLSAAVLAQAGTGYTASKYLAEFRLQDRSRAGRIIGALGSLSLFVNSLSCLNLYLVAKPLANFWLKAPQLADELQTGAVTISVLAMTGFINGALAGLEAYPRMARAAIINGIS